MRKTPGTARRLLKRPKLWKLEGVWRHDPCAESFLAHIEKRFPLPWSAYVRLLSVRNRRARKFYESEALRGGWTVRQLDLQINSQLYERTILSINESVDLHHDQQIERKEQALPADELKDPAVLEFLDLKDEYSETDLEEGVLPHIRDFLLGPETGFGFIERKKRFRVGDEWLRVNLLFFHRRLRCLVIVDLECEELAQFNESHMKVYLNYAKTHWTNTGENPPIGMIVRVQKDRVAVRYVSEGLSDKVADAEYRNVLPEEHDLEAEVSRVRKTLEFRAWYRKVREL